MATEARSIIIVPMLKENETIGVFAVYRKEVRPFSGKQVELLTNFAAQAVIAIENTRLLTELRQRTNDLSESLEQQTAISEVLGVISSSPGDLTPVFDTILENATRICGANFGTLELNENGQFRFGGMYNAPKAWPSSGGAKTSYAPTRCRGSLTSSPPNRSFRSRTWRSIRLIRNTATRLM